MTDTLQHTTTTARTALRVVDADIHNALPSGEALYPYLAERWRRHHAMFGLPDYPGSSYPRLSPNAARSDAWPPSGLPPGADLAFLRAQLLDTWGIAHGILNPLIGVDGPNVEYSAALARAVNDWQIDAWLAPEPRLRAGDRPAGRRSALRAGLAAGAYRGAAGAAPVLEDLRGRHAPRSAHRHPFRGQRW